MPSATYDRSVKLELTEVESRLRRLLLDVATHLDPTSPSELRFTGGWVRDKLLGVGSHDIDVAINDMTGYQFGLKMKEYLEIEGNPEKYGLLGIAEAEEKASGAKKTVDKSRIVAGLHKIEANPEKSKHLETVTTRVFGLDIDLVNLRKEVYTEDSRNPQMEFGTPEEDAERRDATINAMFYNLQTQTIEDFTNRGFDDMEAKIIRTPLEPYQTFKDDPLRVLRLIRFASRLGYLIDPASEECMKDTTIQKALEAKISRERVGVELDKMLKGPDPLMAVQLIDKLGLYHTIFTDPTTELDYKPDAESWKTAYSLANEVIHDKGGLGELLMLDDEHAYLGWILSVFAPWVDAPMPQPAKKGGKVGPLLAVAAAREGIKSPNKICEIISLSVKNSEEIISVKDAFLKAKRTPQQGVTDHNPLGRDTLGMALRRWGISWRSQLLYAMMVERIQASGSNRDIISDYEKFLQHIKADNLLDATDLKPIIDGTALAKALDVRPGPWMRDALEVVMAWQLRNPNEFSVEGAIEAVKDKQGELTTSLIRHFLQLTIRPLFAKMQTANTTETGHKNLNSVRQRYESAEEEEAARPWKHPKNEYALHLLSWAVRNLNSQLTEKNWPLLVPPLLALVDDVEPVFKAKGCQLISALLKCTPPSLLKRTGLAEVFQQAMSLCLSYLPTLTPEDDSILLLSEAYPALFQLAEVVYLTPATTREDPLIFAKKQTRSRMDRYSELLHVHILPSIGHVADSNPRINITLLSQLKLIIVAKGIHIIADLVHLVPLLKNLWTAPFVATFPPLLTAVANTLQQLIANAWPRVIFWRVDMLQGICFAWLQIIEEEVRWTDDLSSPDAGRVLLELDHAKHQMKLCVEMLVNAIEATQRVPFQSSESHDAKIVDIRSELRQLAMIDGRLSDVLVLPEHDVSDQP